MSRREGAMRRDPGAPGHRGWRTLALTPALKELILRRDFVRSPEERERDTAVGTIHHFRRVPKRCKRGRKRSYIQSRDRAGGRVGVRADHFLSTTMKGCDRPRTNAEGRASRVSDPSRSMAHNRRGTAVIDRGTAGPPELFRTKTDRKRTDFCFPTRRLRPGGPRTAPFLHHFCTVYDF